LREIAEKEAEIRLGASVPLMDIMKILEGRYPALANHLEVKAGSTPFPPVMFIRQGRPLKLRDMVAPDDTLSVVPPVSGG